MNVLLTTGVYPPAIGGPATQTRQLALALREAGCEVTVATFRDDRTERDVDGIPLLPLLRHGSLLGKLRQYLSALVDLSRFIRRERPDLVHHVSGCDYLCVVVGVVARLSGVPAVAKYAGDLVWETLVSRGATPPSYDAVFSTLAGRLLRRLERFAFESYRRIWATSEFQRDSLVRLVGVAPERVVLMPNYVDIRVAAKRPETDGPVRILAASRFAPWKRVGDVVEAFARANLVNAQLRIVGGGNTNIEERLRRRAVDLGVADRIEFAGELPPPRMQEAFAEADVFVSAAEYEPFGIVLVEAMSHGIPVVAARVGGVPEVVPDGAAGLLVPARDPSALAGALRTICASRHHRSEMGEAGRVRAATFDLRSNLPAVIAFYRGALEAAHHSLPTPLPTIR